MTGSQKPEKKSKAELELLVKYNGGRVVQNDSRPRTVCIGDQSRHRGTVDGSESLMAHKEPFTLHLCASAEV